MKYLFFPLILVFTFFTQTHAQSNKETAVNNTVERLRKAMIDGNKAELEAVLSDNLSYGHSGGLVEGKAEFVEKIASKIQLPFSFCQTINIFRCTSAGLPLSLVVACNS